MKYRVTYAASKRQLTYRTQAKTGTLELLDSSPTFSESKSVEVEARSQEEAIRLATAKLPAGCDISASAHLLSAKGASA